MTRKHTAILLLFIALTLVSQLSQDLNFGSTYSSSWGGTRAFMLLLDRMNISTSAWLEPFDKLDAKARGQTMFIITPSKYGKQDALIAWVKSGNRAVFVGRYESESKKSTEAKNLESDLTNWATDESVDVVCKPGSEALCSGVAKVLQPVTHFSAVPKEQTAVLVTAGEQVLMTREAAGEGDIIRIADDTPLQNFRIGRYDNLRMFYQLILPGGHVYFDEFHHGYIVPAEGSIKRRQESAMALVGFLVFFLVAGAFSRAVRFGPPSAADLSAQKSSATTEFATVLGLLYEEHLAKDVLRYYVTAWKRRITALLGISRNSDDRYISQELLRRNLISAHEQEALAASLAALSEPGASDPEQYTRVVEQTTQQIVKQLA